MEPSLFAISNQAPGLLALACAIVGSALGIFVWWVFRVFQTEDLEQGLEWRYDISRINELRRLSLFYRVFQPAIGLFAGFNRAAFRDGLPEIHREIQAAGLPRFWLPEEYLARCELIAIGLSPLYAYVCVGWFEMPGLLVAAALTLLTAWVLRRRLASQARRRLHQIKRRMPFLLDLLTLLMEAGSTFLNAMTQAVGEFEGHPIAEEFGRVLTDMSLGKTRFEAFSSMRDRLSDDEMTSIIGAILQGEELGTPLARVFRSQADVLRIKRTQRAETIAGEAGVNMLLPGILIMIATVLIIIGPFMMNYLTFDLSM